MEENLEILNLHGQKTGKVKVRSLIHQDGDYHYSSHLWFIDENNNILLQKRSTAKKLFPSMWCAPVSGHVSEGMSVVDTLLKEAQEEISINLNPEDCFLQGIIRGTYDNDQYNIHEHEYINVFITERKFEINLNLKNEEVDGFKWFSYSEFKDLVDKRDVFLVPAFEEYEMILAYIKHNKL